MPTKKIKINGIVQGVGFRPFVYRTAIEQKLAGFVINSSNGVEIIVSGEKKSIELFIEIIKNENPPASEIKYFSVENIPQRDFLEFKIKKSEQKIGTTLLSPDLAVCEDCVKEMFDKNDKRYIYPFINCTNCGPRFSIIENTPYDRPMTSMKDFEMCDYCNNEYVNPLNRRFHAQPIACSDCGPEFELLDKSLNKISTNNPIKKTIKLLKNGKIIAIKGIGGFHLACDATNSGTIKKLRELKTRPYKPFAIMCREKDLSTIVELNDKNLKTIKSVQAPILILKKKRSILSEFIAPNNPNIGVFIPYAPIHYLLFSDELKYLVMTSGNINNDPISKDEKPLQKICDYFLTNNRPILNRSDDSVILPTKKDNLILRRSRGFVPSPIHLPINTIPTLGMGSALKITFALTKNDQLFLSPYIGNSFSKNTIDFYFEMLEKYKKWYKIEPKLIACDMQPDFYTTRFADEQSIPTIKVQHHHAHIASIMAEHHIKEPVIGIVYDGTGYGTDGNIWGGEIMIADYNKFERLFHLKNMPLPGGDSAIKKPIRIAYAYLKQAGIDTDFLQDISELEKKIISKQIKNNFNIFQTSSMGRLFDCVSTMLGLFPEISFEAQSAMALQFLCDEKNILNSKKYSYEINNENINIQPMLREIVKDIQNGISKNKIAESFHNTIIQFTLEAVQKVSKKSGIKKIVLSGGVMQNKIIVENLNQILINNNFKVYLPSELPSNDGSISVGQVMVANNQYLSN